ncbi:hypothetical protein GCM10023310_69240 [Paenibacillus vulneris]|uniref:YolD-like family protein n=1 Tax=Paenibacillus vulneris TaxID=1133364 RepID=A0ABW3UGT1_9BACL
MSKKLEGNGLWESSRMMLPEHKHSIIQYQMNRNKRTKPLLHEDELEIIFQNISLSLNRKKLIKVNIFGEFEDISFSGVVTSIDQHKNRFKLEYSDGFEWVDFNEVVSTFID